jgi:hypothetical protein
MLSVGSLDKLGLLAGRLPIYITASAAAGEFGAIASEDTPPHVRSCGAVEQSNSLNQRQGLRVLTLLSPRSSDKGISPGGAPGARKMPRRATEDAPSQGTAVLPRSSYITTTGTRLVALHSDFDWLIIARSEFWQVGGVDGESDGSGDAGLSCDEAGFFER